MADVLDRPSKNSTHESVRRRADGSALPESGEAILFFPSGAAGPAFLVTDNFIVLKRFNNSDLYALGYKIEDFAGHFDFELRDAVREQQKRLGMIPDGHPGRAFLWQMGIR